MSETEPIYTGQDLTEGNLNLEEYRRRVGIEAREAYRETQKHYLGRSQVIFEIGKRAMRRITRSGK